MHPKKQHYTKRQVEVKILLLFCFYLVIWTSAIAIFTNGLIKVNDYREKVVEQFICEAPGTEECPRGNTDVVPDMIFIALTSLYPATFLIHLVKLRKGYLKCRQQRPLASE